MADCMMFPNDWHDFIKDYSFIDSEQIYTNGSELIQVFRVIQLIEHLLKEQETKSGHWIDSAGDDKCSVCGATYGDLYPDYQNTNYCPNCGAKMDGEVNG